MISTQSFNTSLLELLQNTTIEERVALLEIQVVVIQDEVSDLETNVDFLFEETIIQDERILTLEQTSVELDEEVEGFYHLMTNKNLIFEQNKCINFNFNSFHFITDLQDTTLALDFRVTVLEENGGSDGNSSVAELEVRVETLEGTAADHETRISAVESDVTGMCVVNY